mmetsp:Transcript_38641/g.86284  ORF Transcript_38641/g.86284 Transcript_38641/m.86284 type:complete len:202 (-) Transcript_38641:465-1070(-)
MGRPERAAIVLGPQVRRDLGGVEGPLESAVEDRRELGAPAGGAAAPAQAPLAAAVEAPFIAPAKPPLTAASEAPAATVEAAAAAAPLRPRSPSKGRPSKGVVDELQVQRRSQVLAALLSSASSTTPRSLARVTLERGRGRGEAGLSGGRGRGQQPLVGPRLFFGLEGRGLGLALVQGGAHQSRVVAAQRPEEHAVRAALLA